MMYSDVVMEKAAGIEPEEGQGIRQQLDRMLEEVKESTATPPTPTSRPRISRIAAERFKAKVKEVLGKDFPDDPKEQLWGGIGAVFSSWNGKRAVSYRRIEGIPDDWGTAVNVQAMVFGNMGDDSATGVAFTRNPATGDNKFYGEWLVNAQGEDVVAGTRTPNPLNEDTKNEQNEHLTRSRPPCPRSTSSSSTSADNLEDHYTRHAGHRVHHPGGPSVDAPDPDRQAHRHRGPEHGHGHARRGSIDERTAVLRVKPEQLDELLHPIVDPAAEKTAEPIAKGLPAGPGGAFGQIVFSADAAVKWVKAGKTVLLVREETNPEDVEGMRAAVGILTGRGGMTSHAALVARGWGKCCIVGAGALDIDVVGKTIKVDGKTFNEGDVLTLNGTRGLVYAGELDMIDATENPRFVDFMKLADDIRAMKVRTNAETPEDAGHRHRVRRRGHRPVPHRAHVLRQGLRGAALHPPQDDHGGFDLERAPRGPRRALPLRQARHEGDLEIMGERPVTFRLLDPPLHEFVPQNDAERAELAKALGMSAEELNRRADELHELNPMMGHRGVRLGHHLPRDLRDAVPRHPRVGRRAAPRARPCHPEIMVPVTCAKEELDVQLKLAEKVHAEVCEKYGVDEVEHLYGTMIEIPRAALTADEIAEVASSSASAPTT
jgi:pyruvate,orthophosphate dikinase